MKTIYFTVLSLSHKCQCTTVITVVRSEW